jgi:hypothetical protein
MLDSVFLNLVRGNRLTAYMGLELEIAGVVAEVKYGKDYSYVEIPLAYAQAPDGSTMREVKRNQHVEIVPACTVNVRGQYRLLVEPNPALWADAVVQGSYYIQSETGKQYPSFYLQARRDIDLSTVEYAVRLYLQP